MGPQRMFGMTPWVRRVIVACLFAFLLQNTLITDPNFTRTFGFDPLAAFARPWTVLTYMFVHASVLHLVFNMLLLYVVGPPVEERMGGRSFLTYYVLCGIGGAVLSLALMQLRPVGTVVGASGAGYGVALAFAWYWPNEPIHVFPLPEPVAAKWLVTFAVGISLVLALLATERGVAHLAHLGGIAAGFIYLYGERWRLVRAERRLRPVATPGVLVHPAAARASRSVGAPAPTPRAPADRAQREIDRVLDKISASGLDSLTPAERKFLTEMSRKMRDRG